MGNLNLKEEAALYGEEIQLSDTKRLIYGTALPDSKKSLLQVDISSHDRNFKIGQFFRSTCYLAFSSKQRFIMAKFGNGVKIYRGKKLQKYINFKEDRIHDAIFMKDRYWVYSFMKRIVSICKKGGKVETFFEDKDQILTAETFNNCALLPFLHNRCLIVLCDNVRVMEVKENYTKGREIEIKHKDFEGKAVGIATFDHDKVIVLTRGNDLTVVQAGFVHDELRSRMLDKIKIRGIDGVVEEGVNLFVEEKKNIVIVSQKIFNTAINSSISVYEIKKNFKLKFKGVVETRRKDILTSLRFVRTLEPEKCLIFLALPGFESTEDCKRDVYFYAYNWKDNVIEELDFLKRKFKLDMVTFNYDVEGGLCGVSVDNKIFRIRILINQK